MASYVYVLKSMKDSGYYFGSADDTAIRLVRHNSGYVKSTKSRRPWEVVYTEEFPSTKEARFREYTLKHNANERYKVIRKIENN